MTAEEMERAIEFLLKSQATHDTQIGELREAIAETNRVVQMLATSQSEVNGMLTRAVTETDARLDRLAATVERFIAGGRNGRE